MPTEIAGVTRCTLCEQKFVGPVGMLIGQRPEGRLIQLLEKITAHFEQKHPEQDQAITVATLQYRGLLRMMNFRTSDPALEQQMDYLRWTIHRQTRAGHLSDDNLALAADELATRMLDTLWAMIQMVFDQSLEPVPYFVEAMKPSLKAEIAKLLIVEFTGLRNQLEEPGKYQTTTVHPPTGPTQH